MSRSKVDFPAPEGPTRAVISPVPTRRSIASTTGRPASYPKVTSENSTSFDGGFATASSALGSGSGWLSMMRATARSATSELCTSSL